MTERKPRVWERFNWVQIEKDGQIEIGPYESYPHHVECPNCHKNTDYNIYLKIGCIHCGLKEPIRDCDEGGG